MGGGGGYYDRDVSSKERRTKAGYTDIAQGMMSKTKLDAAMNPNGKTLLCASKNPVVISFDETGSMGTAPKIIVDKMPMVAGEIARCEYLEDPMVSLSAVGDQFSDDAPIQIGDFSPVRNLDEWFQRIYLEGNGGPAYRESYELIAYFYATRCEIPNAECPIFIFIGDEAFYENLKASDLQNHFGGAHQSVSAKEIFEKLKEKFMGNVFLIHRAYSPLADREIVSQWQRALGKEKVILLPQDLAIADIILGIIALVNDKRTLDEYIEDIKNRPLDLGTGVKYKPQSQERIDEVKKSLEVLAAAIASKTREKKSEAKTRKPSKTSGRKKKENSGEFPTL